MMMVMTSEQCQNEFEQPEQFWKSLILLTGLLSSDTYMYQIVWHFILFRYYYRNERHFIPEEEATLH